MQDTSTIETYRGLVMAQEVDSNGHMNVQFYTTRYDMATGQFLASLGLTASDFRKTDQGFAYVEMRIRYMREVLEDDPIHIETSVIDCTKKVVTIRHEMKHSASGLIVSDAVAKWVGFNKKSRKSTQLPQSLEEKIRAMIVVDQ